MSTSFYSHISSQLDEINQAGLYKRERVISSAQSSQIVAEGQNVINLCANNYLGLSNDPDLVSAAKKSLDSHGFGLSSVRFICGTQDLHKNLEARISSFLGMEDTILYSSCFDANGGLFETLMAPEDAIISDSLNHASIIDGIRLSKAKRYRYANSDMASLEEQLKKAKADGSRHCLIATDGVFSMDGYIAKLKEICDLADAYDALVMVDDSHATGFIGEKGKGTPEHCGVMDRIDILTGTLGKALGGASGGYTSGKKAVIDLLRQRSRPYLFSNSLAPVIASTTVKALDLIEASDALRARLKNNSAYFRKGMNELGFTLLPGDHPIIPVMLHDAKLAGLMAEKLLSRGIYVISFSYPVVPKGQARIRTQMSAAHTTEELDQAIQAFAEVGKELGII